jgi:hypothetical protein
MMQMLAAGGMPLLTDDQRRPDESNPRGYFEHEGVKHSRNDVSWLIQADGKAVKVIHLLLLHLPVDRNYRVIFMVRNLAEVVASQRAMLQQQGRPLAPLTDEALAGVFEKQLATVRQWLAARPNFSVWYPNYREVVTDPVTAAQQLNEFLGGHLDADKMAAVVTPTLYRQRQAPS